MSPDPFKLSLDLVKTESQWTQLYMTQDWHQINIDLTLKCRIYDKLSSTIFQRMKRRVTIGMNNGNMQGPWAWLKWGRRPTDWLAITGDVEGYCFDSPQIFQFRFLCITFSEILANRRWRLVSYVLSHWLSCQRDSRHKYRIYNGNQTVSERALLFRCWRLSCFLRPALCSQLSNGIFGQNNIIVKMLFWLSFFSSNWDQLRTCHFVVGICDTYAPDDQ